MPPIAVPQAIGLACASLALIVMLVPLHRLLVQYEDAHLNDDRWLAPALRVLVPLWVLLATALVCASASGGFDWLHLGRPVRHVVALAGAAGMAALTFAMVGLFVRPGFTPRGLYRPFITLVPLATIVLAVASLEPRLALGLPVHWLRVTWTGVAAVSLAACAVVLLRWLGRAWRGGVAGLSHRLRHRGPSDAQVLAEIAARDPESGFADLLRRANRHESRAVREAATARLRMHAHWPARLAAELHRGELEPALSFLRDATLTPDERTTLARPALAATRRWVDGVPAPNYTTSAHRKTLRRWGTELVRLLASQFAGTDVDFSRVTADLMAKVDPTPPR